LVTGPFWNQFAGPKWGGGVHCYHLGFPLSLNQVFELITGRSYIWTKNDERIFGYAGSTNICIRGSYKEIFISGNSPLPSSTPKRSWKANNPQPYTAEYHGHKLHMDQNEKLVNYGLVHVCAIDGFSRFIPSFACMPTKNNVLIYEHVYGWVECGNLRVQNLTFLRAKYLVCFFLRVLSIYFTAYWNHPCSHTVSRYSVIVFSLLPTLINWTVYFTNSN